MKIAEEKARWNSTRENWQQGRNGLAGGASVADADGKVAAREGGSVISHAAQTRSLPISTPQKCK